MDIDITNHPIYVQLNLLTSTSNDKTNTPQSRNEPIFRIT